MPSTRTVFATLTRESVAKGIDPLTALPLDQAPSLEAPWMPDSMLSLYGTPEFAGLTAEQRRRLSQLEFSLMCSISCSGEKEVIANISRLMLKRRFEHVRPYLFHFIKEENNHIFAFSEFCVRYGNLYPSLYAYAQGDMWGDDRVADLMTFVHVLVFEELGHGLNEILAADGALPPLVRAINAYHVEDEGRHISFGRHLVRELTAELLPRLEPDTSQRLRTHVLDFLQSRHVEYHNMHVYKAVGIPGAYQLRERLVRTRDVRFFIRNERTATRVRSLIRFLAAVGLLPEPSITLC